MSAQPVAPEVPPLRWSSVRNCARKAVYEATGAPARERSRQEEGYLWRGRQLGRDFVIVLASEEKRKGKPWRIFVASGDPDEWPAAWTTRNRDEAAFIAEEAVEWELGVMHPDVIVVETSTVVEVLSSAHASDEMVKSKMLQLVGQIEHTGAKGGAVVVVNPSNPLEYEIFPIARSSDTYGELVDEMRKRIAAVQHWSETGEIPDRVCSKPSEARGHFCQHAEHCFTGWTPPDPDEVLTSEEAIAAATATYLAKKDERELKVSYDAAVSTRKELEARLSDVVELAQLGGAPKKLQIGPIEINRIEVKDHAEVALKKARDAGAWTKEHDELFAPFLGMKGGHVRFNIDRVGDRHPTASVTSPSPVTNEDAA